MLDDKNEPGGDLEWMLQSGQASTPSLVRALVRALVHEHYRRIFELALAELAYPTYARQAADETFLTALQHTDQYRGDLSIQAWLEAIAGTILRQRKVEIEQQSILNPRLNQSILKLYPVRELTPAQVDQAADRLLDQVLARRRLLVRRAGAQEIFIACLAVLMVFGLLRFSGIFPANTAETPASLQSPSGLATNPAAADHLSTTGESLKQPEQLLQEPPSGDSAAESLAESLPFHPLRGLPPQAPLSLKSSHDDVWRRMLLSRFLWHSLYADLVVVLYGPEGYVGPPQTERHQVWIEQDQNALLVSGDPYSGPERVELITPAGTYPRLTAFLQGVADISRLGSQIPWFYMSEETIFSSPYLINFFFLSHNDWPPRLKEFEIVAEDRWAGRPAVVVEQTGQNGRLEARLWLDTATGLILHEQYFAPGDPDQVLLETVITAVAFDQDFPDDIFESTDAYLSWVPPTGRRTSQSISPDGRPYPWLSYERRPDFAPGPPPGSFDPGNSQLLFLYSGDILFGLARATEVQVLADGYPLGKIKINQLFETTCIRSPDGRTIGFFTQEDPPGQLSDLLTLYELIDLEPKTLVFPGTVLVRAAFSPDSRTLAVAGIDAGTLKSRIFLENLQTGERVEVPEMAAVWSLAWHPDGRQLAALHWPSFRQSNEYAVQITAYDLEKQQSVRYYLATDLDWGSAEVAIPLDGWQAVFPLPMGGLDACAAAPGDQVPTSGLRPSLSDQR